jgi:hypothetical protein
VGSHVNLQIKLRYAKQHVESIARHDDEPFAVRQAALQHLTAVIVHEAIQAEAREEAVKAAKIADLKA